MTVEWHEYDTTMGDALSSIITRVLAHPDWDDVTPAPIQTTLTVASGTGTTWNVASTADMYVGQQVVMAPAGVAYARTITAINSATQIVVNAGATVSQPIGTPVETKAQILKATTTRGAPMVINFQAAASYLNGFTYEIMRNHTGAVGGQVDPATRYIYWRANATGSLSTHVVHVTLSVSKEHIFLMVEGPRAGETGATNATIGSVRNYMFMSDLIPYHAGDTVPVVVAGGSPAASAYAATTDYQMYISRSHDDLTSWALGRLGSLVWPTVQVASTIALERDAALDGNKRYLFPYVAFAENGGLRGRLARLFYTGSNAPTGQMDISAPVGEIVEYAGIRYKLLGVNKGDGSASQVWGCLGAASNSGTSTPGRTVVVAVPYADVV